MPSRGGFTLVETLVTVAIVAAVSITVADSVLLLLRTNGSLSDQSASTATAENAFTTIIRYLREANYGADGSYPIASAAADAITFFADTDGSGSTRQVTFRISGTSLLEDAVAPSGIPPTYAGTTGSVNVADGVRNDSAAPLFRYFDSNGNEVPAPVPVADISMVSVSLVVNADPNRLPTYILQSSVTLRNVHPQ